MSIVKMKRLRLIGMQDERDELLRLLQHMGCVEIDEPTDKLADPDWAALTRPDTRAMSAAKETLAGAEAALKTLQKYAPQKSGLLKKRPVITEGQLFDDGAYAAARSVAEHLGGLEKQISTLYAEQNKLKTQRIALRPWMDLDIPLETASTKDVTVLFATVAAGADLDAMEGELRSASDLTEVIRAGADNELRYFVLVCHKSVEETALEVLKQYGASRATLRGWTGTARENDARLEQELAVSAKNLENTIAEVAAFQDKRDDLQLCLDRAQQEIAREEARYRLLDTSTAFFLDGWIPVPEEENLRRKLIPYTVCWETEDPVVEDYPVVPIKLKNNMFTAQASAITEMYSLPAYDGVDPNPLVLPFYVFFFGFMFADLAYGLILAGVCTVMQVYTKPKGGFGQLVRLMIMCGVASAVIGFFTGGFFSNAIPQFCEMMGWSTPMIPFLTGDGIHAPGPIIDAMNDPMTTLVVSLVIGLVQILFGMAIKFYMLCKEGRFMDAVWDVGTWWVLFASIPLAIFGIGTVGSVPVPVVIGCLMLLAQGRNGKGLGRITAVFGAIYNGVTGYFGDILSYSRLMVMMLAGSVIGRVFNILGSMPGNVIVFIIIFLIGHAFNMALNVIGTYVHTSRLQYLEFFKQFYKEGGRPFRPLNIETKYVDIKEEQ